MHDQATQPPPADTAPTKRRRRRRLWPWILAIIVAAAVTTGVVLGNRPEVTTVQTTLVERVKLLESIVSAPGTVEARESVDIQTEVAGVIKELPIKEGDRVRKGQILVRIDPFQTKADVTAMQATLAAALADAKGQEVQIARAHAALASDQALQKAAEAELAQADANLELAQSQLRRIKKLRDKGIETEDRLDTASSQVKVYRAQRNAVQARIEQYKAQVKVSRLSIEQLRSASEAARQRAEAAKANVERSRDILGKTTIYSPLDGLITHLNVEVGERAVPGILSNPQATLMTIADLTSLEARIEVDETDIIQVKADNPVTITVDALPDTPLTGKITEIGNAPVGGTTGLTTSQEGRDFLVKVRLVTPPASLRPGMSCEGEITTHLRRDVLVVPIQALARREVRIDEAGNYLPPDPAQQKREKGAPATRDNHPHKEMEGLFLRTDANKVRFRPVRTGIAGEMDMELFDTDLKGAEVIVGPFQALRKLKEGDPVKVDNSEFQYRRREGKS